MYWDNLDKPWVRRLRTATRLATGVDPAPADEVVRTFASMYYDADPLAEAFVDEVYLGRSAAEGRAMLDRAIEGGVASVPDAPASLVALFADIETDPDWVDWERIDLGARVFRRWGTAVFRFAGSITLEGYSENSVVKPLILTGVYTGGTTRHRFMETVAFWIAVSTANGLRPGGAGRASALRVRVMHVFVRRRLMAHPEWDLGSWGVPISQADATLTLMGGSILPGLGLNTIGYRTSIEEIEATLLFWRYIGHVMGVRPRWYPANYREALQLMFLTVVKAANRSGEDGALLCTSYVDAFAPESTGMARLWEEWDHRQHVGYARFFLPRWSWKRAGLSQIGFLGAIPVLKAPFVFGAETLRRNLPGMETVADRVIQRRRDRWFAHYMGNKKAEYRPVRDFTR